MKKLELTPRLRAVASFVPQGARLADIGTDHAYLPVSLLLEGRIPSAVAADINRGPLERAKLTAQEYGCTDRMSFRLCDGLREVKSDETDVIAIAGMGGETIADILSAARWVGEQEIPVILQPMSTQPELRRWLWQNGFDIVEEKLVKEGDTLYVVIFAKPGPVQPMTTAQEWAGRQYQGMDAPLREEYLDQLLGKLEWSLAGLAKSKEGTSGSRYLLQAQLHADLTAMKEEWKQWQL